MSDRSLQYKVLHYAFKKKSGNIFFVQLNRLVKVG